MLKLFVLAVVVVSTLAESDDLGFVRVFRVRRAVTESKNQFLVKNLACHNSYRAKHHAPPLQYRQDLMDYAQNYAQKLADTDKFQHSNGPWGENLFAGSGTYDGNSACNSWYSEVKKYDYSKDNPSNFGEVGHFTQLVWVKSKFMGIGYATSKTNWTYICGSYDPPGNYRNQYKANVLKP